MSESETHEYELDVDPEQDDRATEIKLRTYARPHMRALHASWIAFFAAFFAWFAVAPLLPIIKTELGLTKKEVWASNICSVSSTIVMRLIVGPLCDLYGPKRMMALILIFGSIPTYLLGTVTSFEGLCISRFFIGFIGASFVVCQYWTSQMFATNVVGSANAIVGGWGNLGGGVTQMFMGAAMYPLFLHVFFNGNVDMAWRTVFIVPATITVVIGILIYFLSDDTPRGDFLELKAKSELYIRVSFKDFFLGLKNVNTVLLFVQYGCCFGVELTMNNAAATYFVEELNQDHVRAASIASSFGFMNLVARAIGGILSDYLNKDLGMRGRLIVQWLCLLAEGAMILIFAQQKDLGAAVTTMIVFSICVQAAEGATFSIVPYVDPLNLGVVNGIVGAGGNMGALLFGFVFLYGDNFLSSLRLMGYIVIFSSYLTYFISIPGHLKLLGGVEMKECQAPNSRKNFEAYLNRPRNSKYITPRMSPLKSSSKTPMLAPSPGRKASGSSPLTRNKTPLKIVVASLTIEEKV
mmetsp:Transcript_37083/g.37760  ORF Transcript_37083/g.37760 Transcript_37083/m.37760 type:complete len:522 (-) Transcript_37083:300-1865(-)